MNKLFLFLVLNIICLLGHAQHLEVPLWADNIPNYQETDEKEIRVQEGVLKIRNVKKPGLEVFIPSERIQNGQAVVICPGGGYAIMNWDWEGTDIAKWLNSQGITAIVLKYRLPRSKSNIVSYKSPILDAQRAVRLVRQNAKAWGIDSTRIGIMGFSAGGHLAATLSVHYNEKYAEPSDSIDLLSARPDFSILVYPVVTFKDGFTDSGSRRRLLNNNLDEDLILHFSAEEHVNADTPPTFIMHSTDDTGVPVQNSLKYYEALVNNKVQAEMHLYPIGWHGYALARDNEYLSTWTELLEAWLKRY
ncbi:alpha/beta hydrolase [uncultured Draconibacterium sp.]|uniref:alpha/beta hydrolase n=1 Tax=uncultured Draconibacterium sp. TaxID=1573823 RepID=UPI0032607134